MTFDPESVSAEEFELAVRRRAASDPGKVYKQPKVWDEIEEVFVPGDGCVYVERDHESNQVVGSCLIGCALIDVGVPVEKFKSFNSESADVAISNLGLSFHPRLVAWAENVQNNQDEGIRWGAAVDGADRNAYTY